MIKISEGPLLRKFADCFIGQLDYDRDEAMNEVITWVSNYVNGPWTEAQKLIIEPTERERLESIKKYIDWRISTSVTAKAKEYANAA